MKRLLFLLFCITVAAQSAEKKNLLIFLDPDHEEQPGQDFNVAYQLAIALMQRPGEIILSRSLLQSLVLRKDLFLQKMNQSQSAEAEFVKMFARVQKTVKNKSLRSVNKEMDQQWFQNIFPRLSALSAEDYKQLAFNFLSFYVLKNLFDWWNVTLQKNGYILCSLHGHTSGRLLTEQELLSLPRAKAGSIIPIVKSIAKKNGEPWVIYLSGHGYPCDSRERQEPLISGMTVQEFQDFLLFLNEQINTRLLAYNSCFAGGKDGLAVYKKNGKALQLSFPVIMTSITDAPTYVFGTPSGFKLPPYTADNKLDSSLVRDGELQPFFLQHFADFFEYAHKEFCGAECMFLINHYKECLEHGCPIYKVENMPMIRYPYASEFLPLDQEQYCVVNDSDGHDIIIQDKKAALWYQKNVHQRVCCLGSMPIFISMFHEKKNHHRIDELIVSTGIESFLKQAFILLDEQSTEIVWEVKRLIAQTAAGRKEYRNVRVVQNKQGIVWNY